MYEKLINLLNQIGINEDYIEYFDNSYIEKIVVSKTTNRFHFIFNLNNILDDIICQCYSEEEKKGGQ